MTNNLRREQSDNHQSSNVQSSSERYVGLIASVIVIGIFAVIVGYTVISFLSHITATNKYNHDILVWQQAVDKQKQLTCYRTPITYGLMALEYPITDMNRDKVPFTPTHVNTCPNVGAQPSEPKPFKWFWQ